MIKVPKPWTFFYVVLEGKLDRLGILPAYTLMILCIDLLINYIRNETETNQDARFSFDCKR